MKVFLIPSPYQLANGDWVPRIKRRIDSGDKITEVDIEKWDERFESKQLTNEFLRAEIEVMKLDSR